MFLVFESNKDYLNKTCVIDLLEHLLRNVPAFQEPYFYCYSLRENCEEIAWTKFYRLPVLCLNLGRTVLVIAHRLSTIRDADVIAVVHSGRIVEVSVAVSCTIA